MVGDRLLIFWYIADMSLGVGQNQLPDTNQQFRIYYCLYGIYLLKAAFPTGKKHKTKQFNLL